MLHTSMHHACQILVFNIITIIIAENVRGRTLSRCSLFQNHPRRFFPRNFVGGDIHCEFRNTHVHFVYAGALCMCEGHIYSDDDAMLQV